MKKRYMIRFTNGGRSVITAISNYSELMDIIKGGASGSIIETKISDNMPLVLHNAIGKHNHKINQKQTDES